MVDEGILSGRMITTRLTAEPNLVDRVMHHSSRFLSL